MLGIVGAAIFAMIMAPVAFPNECDKLSNAAVKAAKCTGAQISASAYTDRGKLVKAYMSKEKARSHRSDLKAGTKLYLPDGTGVTVQEGLGEIESDGWWYAWKSV